MELPSWLKFERPRKWLPASLGVLQRVQESGLILSCALALFLCLALYTFHPADPGWSQTATGAEVQNAAGTVGAWVADWLLFFFGASAFALPFAIAIVGWQLFRGLGRLSEIDFMKAGLRLIGWLLILLSVLGLASLNADDIHYYSAGGLIGDMLSQVLEGQFNLLGATLLLLTGFAMGLPLGTGVSWLKMVDRLGCFVVTGLERLARLILGERKSVDDTLQPAFAAAAPGADTETTAPVEVAAVDDEEDQADEAEPQAKTSWLRRRRKPVPEAEPVDITPAAKEEPALEEMPSVRAEPSFALDNLDSIFADSPAGAAPAAKAQSTQPVAEVAADVPPETPAAHPVPAVQPAAPVAEPAATAEVAESHESLPWEMPAAEEKPAPVAKAPAKPVELSPYAVPPEPAIDPNLPPLPTLELLNRPPNSHHAIPVEELEMAARLVERKLLDFGIEVQVVDIFPGPVITRFELDLAPGVKVSRITSLSKDLARSLSAVSVRVVEVIPGKSVIGLELPNAHRETVYMGDVISCAAFDTAASPLTMVLGKDIAGDPVVVDLAKFPHVLVAGTTGSGKSVGINTMILSMLYKSQPEDVRMILIDPKMLELSVYEGIPHLLTEVVTDMKDAANALRWCVGEMERRYKLMSAMGVRNIKGFNTKVKDAIEAGEPIPDPLWKAEESMLDTAPELEKLPYIVVVIDEFADMMMVVGKKVEELIARIAQKARAAGIHLVLATQRPSVNVVTGLIKANIPTRISFLVSTKIDSRTVLDQPGAETLLGMGDMLYLPPGSGAPVRVHGAFVDDPEVHRVVDDWKKRGRPQYIEEILSGDTSPEALLPGEKPEGSDDDLDPLYDEAVFFVTQSRRGSISSVQRKFKIGYNRAARLIEQMEEQGVVSPPGHNGNRDVLAPPPAGD